MIAYPLYFTHRAFQVVYNVLCLDSESIPCCSRSRSAPSHSLNLTFRLVHFPTARVTNGHASLFFVTFIPLPSTLLRRSHVTLWRRSLHLTSHTFSESHACVGNATLIHAVLTSHLSKGESATRREKRIEKHASGQCPYILSPIIYLYRSGRCTDQQSCTIYLTVTMTQMVEPFLCIWHTYLAIWKARKDEG